MMDLNQVLNLFTKGSIERKGHFQKIALMDGSEYVGDVASGRRHGVGYMIWPDGLKYMGDWVDNAATGEGILLWPDGASYYGQVVRGKRHGRGLYIDVSGHYAGEWRAGLRHGLGTQVSVDSVYCGEWVDGARCGWGNITYVTGNHYEGMWVNDVMEGYGSMTWVTAAKPLLPKRDGDASSVASNVNLSATNTMLHSTINTILGSEDTTMDLARTITFNIGALAPGPLGPFNPSVASSEAVFEKYVGRWHNGKPHGQGEYALFFHDGAARDNPFQTINHFVGTFCEGLRHGKGTQLYADGRVYEGDWVRNIKNGHGFLTKPDGSRSSVVVVNDVVMPEPSSSENSSPRSTATGKGGNAATGTTLNSNKGVVKETNVSTEDALQIRDMADEKEVTDIKGLVTNYKPLLKYLYTAYATIQPHTGYYSAIEQLLSAEEDVPNPSFLQHPVVSTIPALQGVSRDKRNKRLCQRANEIIHTEAVRNANGIAARFSRAADAMGESASFDRGLSAMQTQQNIADEAFNVTYAASPLSKERNTFRSFVDVSMPTASPRSDRKALQNSLTRFQFLQMLDDARVLDSTLYPTRVNNLIAVSLARDPNRTITPPQQMRAMLRTLDKSSDQLSFGVFVESMVRVADARMVGEGPWFASCILKNLSLIHRIQFFFDYYIVPVGSALQAVALDDGLRCIGIEPFFATSSGNQTIPEMKRNAARLIQARERSKKGEGGTDTALLSAAGAALEELAPATCVSTIVNKEPIRVEGTASDALQLWTIRCVDTATQNASCHGIIVHSNSEDGLSFGGIITQRAREDYNECIGKSVPKIRAIFEGVCDVASGGGGDRQDGDASRQAAAHSDEEAGDKGTAGGGGANAAANHSNQPDSNKDANALIRLPIPVSAEVLSRVPCVVQQVERSLLLLIRVFEALQREERGMCRMSDVLSALHLSGFLKEKKKRVVKTVIDSKPKPPPPPPTGKEKGKAQKAPPPAERRPSTPQRSAAGGGGGKMNKKQLQIQQAMDAEADLRRQEEELQKKRIEMLLRLDALPEPESLSTLPPAEVSMDAIMRSVLLEAFHILINPNFVSAFPHRARYDPSTVLAALAEAASPITKQFCKVNPMLEEVIQLQRLAAKSQVERCASAKPVPTPAGTRTQIVLMGDNILLSFDDFITFLISVFLTAFPSRTPMQAIRVGFLYLPKVLGVLSAYRNVQAVLPPFIDADPPLPVRIQASPEDPKARKK